MKRLTTLSIALALFVGTARAQVTNHFVSHFTNAPLWDISGDWTFEEDGETADWHLVHSAKGSVSGTHVDVVDLPYMTARLDSTLKGRVAGTPSRAVFIGTLKGSGAGVYDGLSIRLRSTVGVKFLINPKELEMVGKMRIKMTVVGYGSSSTLEEKIMDLPEGMDGSWDLAADLVAVGNRLNGTASVVLSTGRTFPYYVTGSTNPKTGIRTLKLKGHDESRGTGFVVTLDGENVLKVVGNLLGQKVRI